MVEVMILPETLSTCVPALFVAADGKLLDSARFQQNTRSFLFSRKQKVYSGLGSILSLLS